MADFKPFNWTCNVCGQPTTIVDTNFTSSAFDLYCEMTPVGQGIEIRGSLIECPNPDCHAQHMHVRATHGPVVSRGNGYGKTVKADPQRPVGIGSFQFLPTTPKPLSVHVPAGVVEDYAEANLIAELSPKSAATLARRALQGMVRDFWGVSKRTLAEELKAIEEKCDTELYLAMVALKAVGNIGAHPERDINLIVEIDPGEAGTLIQLIQLLDQEWYVAREKRRLRVSKVHELALQKKADQQAS